MCIPVLPQTTLGQTDVMQKSFLLGKQCRINLLLQQILKVFTVFGCRYLRGFDELADAWETLMSTWHLSPMDKNQIWLSDHVQTDFFLQQIWKPRDPAQCWWWEISFIVGGVPVCGQFVRDKVVLLETSPSSFQSTNRAVAVVKYAHEGVALSMITVQVQMHSNKDFPQDGWLKGVCCRFRSKISFLRCCYEANRCTQVKAGIDQQGEGVCRHKGYCHSAQLDN